MNTNTYPPKNSSASRHLIALMLAACPLSSFAAEPVPPPGVSLATMMQTFGILALILGLFVTAAWFVRRMNAGKGFMSNHGPLKVISALTLGPRERIILVEADETWLIIGIVPGQIRTLHTFPKGNLPAEASAEGQFGHWLKQFREQRSDAKE